MLIGLTFAWLDSVWPHLCFKAGIIESFDPPPPLMGEPATGTANPYPDSNKDDSKLSGHLLVLVRVVNMILISPIVEVR